jgi:hypothetical protein
VTAIKVPVTSDLDLSFHHRGVQTNRFGLPFSLARRRHFFAATRAIGKSGAVGGRIMIGCCTPPVSCSATDVGPSSLTGGRLAARSESKTWHQNWAVDQRNRVAPEVFKRHARGDVVEDGDLRQAIPDRNGRILPHQRT